MRSRSSKLVYLLSLVLPAVLFIAGCTPTATAVIPANTVKPAAPAVAPSPTQEPTQAPTPVPATATALPTATAQATATATSAAATPTATEAATIPQANQQPDQAVAAWCLPFDAAVSNAKDPLQPPANAKKAKYANGVLELRNLPSNGCVILYTFDNAAPTGLKLEIYELKQKKPFFTVDLQPVSSKAETVWAFIRHTMIVAPPKESLSFTLVVRDPLGQVLHSDQVNIHSWVPEPTGVPSKGDCGCTVVRP